MFSFSAGRNLQKEATFAFYRLNNQYHTHEAISRIVDETEQKLKTFTAIVTRKMQEKNSCKEILLRAIHAFKKNANFVEDAKKSVHIKKDEALATKLEADLQRCHSFKETLVTLKAELKNSSEEQGSLRRYVFDGLMLEYLTDDQRTQLNRHLQAMDQIWPQLNSRFFTYNLRRNFLVDAIDPVLRVLNEAEGHAEVVAQAERMAPAGDNELNDLHVYSSPRRF